MSDRASLKLLLELLHRLLLRFRPFIWFLLVGVIITTSRFLSISLLSREWLIIHLNLRLILLCTSWWLILFPLRWENWLLLWLLILLLGREHDTATLFDLGWELKFLTYISIIVPLPPGRRLLLLLQLTTVVILLLVESSLLTGDRYCVWIFIIAIKVLSLRWHELLRWLLSMKLILEVLIGLLDLVPEGLYFRLH